MTELPEVETTRRGIAPYITGCTVIAVTLRTAKLRLPLQPDLGSELTGRRITAVTRRGKYLLLDCGGGTLLLHLGMSGHLRLVPAGTAAGKYDHVELALDSGVLLRLSDPRKFGTVIWLNGEPLRHPLLAGLGPEPLEGDFSAAYLLRVSRQRRVAVKILLMNSRVVAGVGNIYANEALFRAGIDPKRPAGSLTEAECGALTAAVKQTLAEAIAFGGTTLHDFPDAAGRLGYFRLELRVYGRGGEPCPVCTTPIRQSRLGGRSTFWCPLCQGG